MARSPILLAAQLPHLHDTLHALRCATFVTVKEIEGGSIVVDQSWCWPVRIKVKRSQILPRVTFLRECALGTFRFEKDCMHQVGCNQIPCIMRGASCFVAKRVMLCICLACHVVHF